MTELFTVWLTKGAMIDDCNQLTSWLNNSSIVGVKIFDKRNKIYSGKILTGPNFIKNISSTLAKNTEITLIVNLNKNPAHDLIICKEFSLIELKTLSH